MSSPERAKLPRLKISMALLLAGLLLPACTVQPLYMNAPVSPTGQSYSAELASIEVKPVTTREAQQVRNHLIFLFGGGQGQPASPSYVLDLRVNRIIETAALIQVGLENEPTAATVTMKSNYVLLTPKGKVVANGSRQIMSSFDVPRQEFAAIRARRDAEDRAARELAELVRLAVVQDLAALPAK